jgi:hypothetical protein
MITFKWSLPEGGWEMHLEIDPEAEPDRAARLCLTEASDDVGECASLGPICAQSGLVILDRHVDSADDVEQLRVMFRAEFPDFVERPGFEVVSGLEIEGTF